MSLEPTLRTLSPASSGRQLTSFKRSPYGVGPIGPATSGESPPREPSPEPSSPNHDRRRTGGSGPAAEPCSAAPRRPAAPSATPDATAVADGPSTPQSRSRPSAPNDLTAGEPIPGIPETSPRGGEQRGSRAAAADRTASCRPSRGTAAGAASSPSENHSAAALPSSLDLEPARLPGTRAGSALRSGLGVRGELLSSRGRRLPRGGGSRRRGESTGPGIGRPAGSACARSGTGAG